MSNYQIVRQEPVNGISCDFYGDGAGEFYMTRQQIGEALEYENPATAISNIHRAHKDRLDKFSTLLETSKVEGRRNVTREVVLYSAKGVYEICRWSRQPKADEFYDRVYDILEGLRTGKLKIQPSGHKKHLDEAHESLDKMVLDFFQCLEDALSDGRYYLVPRTAQDEYGKPLEETMGIYDNCFYYLRGNLCADLFSKVHPEIGKRGLYAILKAAGISAGYPEGSFAARSRRYVETVRRKLYGKDRAFIRLLVRKVPIKLTTYGENRYYIVDKVGMTPEEYESFMRPDEW